jgi:hypothetical protein
MGFTRFIAVAGAVVFALWATPAVHGAGAVFKCHGAGGKLTFSDKPCPEEQKQETVKAAPPPGVVDVSLVCGSATRPTGDYSRKWGVCQQMRTCAENKGDPSCRVYCTPFAGADTTLPGVTFGPTSPSCLRYNGFIGGKNWAQSSERVNSGSNYEVIPAQCVDANGRATRLVVVACETGTTNCAMEAPLRGRKIIAKPIDELLTKTCGT